MTDKKYDIYFQFKPNIRKSSRDIIYMRDIIMVSCSLEIRNRIENIIVSDGNVEGGLVISAIQIIQLIQQEIENSTIYLVGEGKSLIEPKCLKEKANNSILHLVKIFLICLFLFIGSAFAIMYFHADVNMLKAQQNIYYFITGVKENKPLLINISYSIGIGIGIAFFFDAFSIKKKKVPGPLELEMYLYDKDIYSYRKDEEEKEEKE